MFFYDPKRSQYDPQRSQRENQTAAGSPAGNIILWRDISELQVLQDFQKTQDQVLAYFNLEQRPLHYLMLFSYPFQANHLLNKIAVETLAEFNSMGGKYFMGCYLATGYPNDLYGCNTLIDKVEHLFWRLSKRAEYLKKKGNY